MSYSLKTAARSLGFDLVGVSSPLLSSQANTVLDDWLARGYDASMTYMRRHRELRESANHLLPGVKSVVMVGINYNQTPPEDPKIARYALGRDYHKVIRNKLTRLCGSELADFENRICVDSAPLQERAYASQAGLGWFGKNTMLINSERGSWFLLGAILTTAELQPDAPAIGGCGTCTKCIEACPTGAIIHADDRWQVDSRKCISYQTIEHKGDFEPETNLHGWLFGCDICQEVCPFNTPRESQPLRAQKTREPDFSSRDWPTTEAIRDLPESDWNVLTAGTPVRRANYKGLIRNSLRVLNHPVD